jgi:hypothetical protein
VFGVFETRDVTETEGSHIHTSGDEWNADKNRKPKSCTFCWVSLWRWVWPVK